MPEVRETYYSKNREMVLAKSQKKRDKETKKLTEEELESRRKYNREYYKENKENFKCNEKVNCPKCGKGLIRASLKQHQKGTNCKEPDLKTVEYDSIIDGFLQNLQNINQQPFYIDLNITKEGRWEFEI